MKNPFLIGRQFEPESFLDREKETAFILDEVTQNGNLVLFGSRRLGKTWLIEKVFDELEKKELASTLFFDIQQYATLAFFVNDFVLKVYRASSYEDKIENFFKHFLPTTFMHFSLSLGPVKFELQTQKAENIHQAMIEVLQIPEKMSQEKPFVIAFDEFQEFKVLDETIIPVLRSQIQHQKFATYIFAGSKESVIKKMFLSKNGPFFQSMKHLHLVNYLPIASCRDFLTRKFYDTDKKITPDGIDTLLDYSKGHPLFMQILARRSWQKTNKICDQEIVISSLQEELDINQYEYEAKINLIHSREQRAALFSLAKDETELFKRENLDLYDIHNPNTMNRAILQLIEMGLIEKIDRGKYRFSDLFFKEFLKQRLM